MIMPEQNIYSPIKDHKENPNPKEANMLILSSLKKQKSEGKGARMRLW